MSETTVEKQSTVTSVKNFVVKRKTPILITLAATSVALNVAQARGIKLHNEFLKEHDLFDLFYELPSTEA